jgi:hypothetical protein
LFNGKGKLKIEVKIKIKGGKKGTTLFSVSNIPYIPFAGRYFCFISQVFPVPHSLATTPGCTLPLFIFFNLKTSYGNLYSNPHGYILRETDILLYCCCNGLLKVMRTEAEL